ncbi:DUF1540 domain-containing protein [Microbulbifer yueqingensis]|uniref:DUF1540 domain-containing protein n=1 Tax=Microbulbifer yueqingensis TaxID=658219 RepID=A0A1G8XB56_9GAMM|nr:DUF1540 domain-containing protein [Microbulbifer yueqingensis]SDJ87607.1 protein of unknown function [Microbulbifer yueqingensis]
MIIATDMPEVARCAVNQCAFNSDDACHARAITIGEGSDPDCDTFFDNSHHTHSSRTAGVGACKMTDCSHNEDLECSAESIQVGKSGDSVECLTYNTRH